MIEGNNIMQRQRKIVTALLGTASILAIGTSAVAQERSNSNSDEIVVTATRTEQKLSDVPMSISAYSQASLDSRGVRAVDDITKYTPGVQFTRSGYGNTSSISIRGVSSGSGPATTAVYLDDTPIQVRDLGNSAANPYPVIFDLERIEVLRGPQGTLFGAGAQGGALRFITPEPNLDEFEGYVRSEFALTKNGAPSYEAGGAIGGPIVQDKVGFRASAYHRHDGGYVDRAEYPDTFNVYEDENSVNTSAFRVALKWQPSDNFSVTPSLFYQQTEVNGTNSYWEGIDVQEPLVFGDIDGQIEYPISNRNKQRYVNGDTIASTNDDEMVLGALKLRWDLGAVQVSSDTSYFDRYEHGTYDYTAFMNNIFGFGNPSILGVLSTPGYTDIGVLWNKQKNWTQELRINSADPDSRLTWVVGFFYSNATQQSLQKLQNPFIDDLVPLIGGAVGLYGGLDVLPGNIAYFDTFEAVDTQYAGFGEASLEILEGLTLTAGVRVAHTEIEFFTEVDGPAQGGFATFTGTQSDSPITPKFSLTYEIDDNNLIYATASKGFRLGGVNRSIPTNAACASDLADVGFTNAPTSYDSDTLWNYEVGSKNSFANGRVRMAASAYLIKWKDIIGGVSLPECGFSFTDNLGSATIKGVDLQLDMDVTENFFVGAMVGYNKGTYDESLMLPGATRALTTKGNTTSLLSPWVVTLSSQYDFAEVGSVVPYARADASYRTRNKEPGNDAGWYDPFVNRNPTEFDLRLRAGFTTQNGLDLSVFVNNATNVNPRLNQYHVVTNGQIFTADAKRPITIGLTGSYRF